MSDISGSTSIKTSYANMLTASILTREMTKALQK